MGTPQKGTHPDSCVVRLTARMSTATIMTLVGGVVAVVVAVVLVAVVVVAAVVVAAVAVAAVEIR